MAETSSNIQSFESGQNWVPQIALGPSIPEVWDSGIPLSSRPINSDTYIHGDPFTPSLRLIEQPNSSNWSAGEVVVAGLGVVAIGTVAVLAAPVEIGAGTVLGALAFGGLLVSSCGKEVTNRVEDCLDADNDGHFTDYCSGGTDCNDDNASINPDADEIPYDDMDQDCSGADLTDVDEDGYDAEVVGGDDCDDSDANIHPGSEPRFYRDADGDGYGDSSDSVTGCEAPEGYVTNDDDCDDEDRNVNPGADEVPYDTIDQDCDGEDLTDVDEDGYDSLYAPFGSDCNDNDASTNPGAEDIPGDNIDQDCDGVDATETPPFERIFSIDEITLDISPWYDDPENLTAVSGVIYITIYPDPEEVSVTAFSIQGYSNELGVLLYFSTSSSVDGAVNTSTGALNLNEHEYMGAFSTTSSAHGGGSSYGALLVDQDTDNFELNTSISFSTATAPGSDFLGTMVLEGSTELSSLDFIEANPAAVGALEGDTLSIEIGGVLSE